MPYQQVGEMFSTYPYTRDWIKCFIKQSLCIIVDGVCRRDYSRCIMPYQQVGEMFSTHPYTRDRIKCFIKQSLCIIVDGVCRRDNC